MRKRLSGLIVGPLVVFVALLFLPESGRAQVIMEDFEGDLSQWTGKDGGPHSAVIVEDPLNPGNHVVAFPMLDDTGHIFSVEFPVVPDQIYSLRFDYLGLALPLSPPDNFGGFVGIADEKPGWIAPGQCTCTWMAGTVLVFGAFVELVDDGAWHSYTIKFNPFTLPNVQPTDGTIHIMLEDWNGQGTPEFPEGVPGDVFFDNIRLERATNYSECPPDTMLNPGQAARLEFSMHNPGVLADVLYYNVTGDPLLTFAHEDGQGYSPGVFGVDSISAGETQTIGVWTLLDTMATPGDTLKIDFSVLPLSDPGKSDSCEVEVIVGSTVTGIDAHSPTIFRATLHSNVPNPFNPRTTITYSLPYAGRVNVLIYDVAGRLVRELVSETRPAGEHSVEWNGLDDRGAEASSGVYFVRLWVGKESRTRKLVLLK